MSKIIERKYNLRWDTYKNNLCDGFSRLQQMQEFVDVTLAAGGHLVKAHQNILALASPYLKEMLKSVPSQHPVIFLGPINHKILTFILEYIYTGEVEVPLCVLPSFLEASKLLHITGLKDMQLPENLVGHNITKPSNSDNITTQETEDDRPNIYVTHMNINNDSQENEELDSLVNYSNNHISAQNDNGNDLPARSYQVSEELDPHANLSSSDIVYTEINAKNDYSGYTSNIQQEEKSISYNEDYDMTTDIESHIQSQIILNDQEIKDNPSQEEHMFKVDIATESGLLSITTEPNTNESDKEGSKNELYSVQGSIVTAMYTISTRGCLQMILNRYIYNLHHTAVKGRKRRWRCVEYRRNHCPAFVETMDDNICGRKHTHAHFYHDNKILKIGKKGLLFTSMIQASKAKKDI